jgi:hypothetical protein
VSHSHARWAGSLIAAGFCACSVGWLWNSISTPGPTPEQIKIETDAQRLQLTQAQKQAQIDAVNAKLDSEWHVDRASTWLRLLVIGSLATLTVCVPAGAVAGGLHLWHKRDMPDKATGAVAYGKLSAQDRIQINAGVMQTRNLLATNPALPSGLQHLHTVHSPRITGPAALDPELVVSRSAEVPVWRQLIGAGAIGGPGQPIYIGRAQDDGRDLSGSLKLRIGSVGIGGKPRQGKSWLATSLACQIAQQGGRFLISDGHAMEQESFTHRLRPLEPLFLAPPATTPEGTLGILDQAITEMDRRGKCPCQSSPSRCAECSWPLSVIIDEFTELMQICSAETRDEIVRRIKRVSVAGPKRLVPLCLMAHSWSAHDLGADSSSRGMLMSFYLFAMRPNDAVKMTGLPERRLQEVSELSAGECLVYDTECSQPTRIYTPQMTDMDIVDVAARVLGSQPVFDPIPAVTDRIRRGPIRIRNRECLARARVGRQG